MIAYNTAVVLAGASLLGASAGLVGSFAVLRRRALLGDALAHAALPGLCVAFLILDRRSLPAMLVGAFVSGIIGVGLIVALRRSTRTKEDAAIGIVLSVFFGIGLALSRMIQNRSASGSRAGLDSYIFGSAATMRIADLWWIAGVAALCLVVVLLLYKEFKLVAFDMGFARVQGWPAGKLDLLLMGLIAITVVVGLPAAGALLIAAMLILPAAAARFWTERLGVMLVLSSLLGGITAACGTLLSAQFSGLPTGPTIVLAGATAFLFSALFARRRGGLARRLAQRRFRRRLEMQSLLRRLYDLSESSLPNRVAVPAGEVLRRSSLSPGVVRRAASHGWISMEPADKLRLTEAGLNVAARIARGHRLWQLFLVEYADQHGSFGELDVENADERLPRELVESLEARLAAEGRLPTQSQQASEAAP
jgi:manganese/zinc/iron transport system permease protein